MWCSATPKNKIPRLSTHFNPFATVIRKPLHAVFIEAVPFWHPSRDPFLVFHVLVELLAQQMCAVTRNQSPIILSARQQIHKSLQTVETRLDGVLILMRSRLIGRKVAAVMELDVHSVEGGDEIGSGVDFLEGGYDGWLGADVPDKFLVGDAIV